mmetsp:Transcript_10272/g.31747  ORF Transcript_10272/g.31747 Transcript_10272/m.31747 type:complete len:132 (-) Transcript_10272:34-429(-)
MALAQNSNRLETLILRGTGSATVTPAVLRFIAAAPRWPRLRHLDVKNSGAATDAFVAAVIPHTPRLRHLDVAWSNVTKVAVKAVVRHCRMIESVDVSYTDVPGRYRKKPPCVLQHETEDAMDSVSPQSSIG